MSFSINKNGIFVKNNLVDNKITKRKINNFFTNYDLYLEKLDKNADWQVVKSVKVVNSNVEFIR
ncbi:hypothetical protein ACW95P_01690 [Candidatus Mycoplasma pogonae]